MKKVITNILLIAIFLLNGAGLSGMEHDDNKNRFWRDYAQRKALCLLKNMVSKDKYQNGPYYLAFVNKYKTEYKESFLVCPEMFFLLTLSAKILIESKGSKHFICAILDVIEAISNPFLDQSKLTRSWLEKNKQKIPGTAFLIEPFDQAVELVEEFYGEKDLLSEEIQKNNKLFFGCIADYMLKESLEN